MHVGVLPLRGLQISGVQFGGFLGGYRIISLVLSDHEVLRVFLGYDGPVGSVVKIVLVFMDAGEIVVVGVVDDCVVLIVFSVVCFQSEVYATVGKWPEAIVHQLVYRSGVEYVVVFLRVLYVLEIGVEPDLDVRSVEHLLDHPGISFGRDPLIGVLEIPAVPAEVDGDAGGDGAVYLGGVLAPLFLGVMDEDVVVDVLGEEAEVCVILFHEVADGDLGAVFEPVEKFSFDPVGEVFGEAAADAVEVERDRDLISFDDRVYAVHVGVEGGELREETPYLFVRSVEDVGSVFVDHYVVFVEVVEAVATKCTFFIDDLDFAVCGFGGYYVCDGRSRYSGTDD